MQKSSKPKDGQVSLFQAQIPSPALPREVSQKTVSLLARMLREHAGRGQDLQSEASDE
jgi:hypothetical protein